MKKYLMSIALCLPMLAWAQRGHFREEIESFRIGYLTKKLSLTTDEAKVFWPVYESFTKEMMALHKERIKRFFDEGEETNPNMSHEENNDNSKEMDDKKLAVYADEFIAVKEKELALIKKYYQQFKAVLPPQKVGLLCLAQEEFKKQLLKKARHHDFERGDWRRRD